MTLGPMVEIHCWVSRAAAAMLLATLVAACATLPPQTPPTAADRAWVRAGAGLLDDADPVPAVDLHAMLHVTDEMRRFALAATAASSTIRGRMSALSTALAAKDGLNLRYDASATLTAEQAFAERRVNCLSFTVLFIALARDIGIPASFNEVDVPPIWDLGDDQTLLLYKHVNARVDLYAPLYEVVDISGDEYDPAFDQRAILDDAALAQFDNNRAVELLLAQQPREALRHELRALALSPDAAYLWANLASIYLKNGSPRAARIAVGESLARDSAGLLAQDTAAQVYEELGEPRLAHYFREQSHELLARNPYHHYQLALAAFRRDDAQGAYDEARRAIDLYPHDHRFFFLMAVVLERLGEHRLANDSMQAALDLARDPAQQERYRNKFAQLGKHG